MQSYEVVVGDKGNITVNVVDKYQDGAETTKNAINSLEHQKKDMANEIKNKKNEIRSMKKYIKHITEQIEVADLRLAEFKKAEKKLKARGFIKDAEASSESPKEDKPKQ